MWKSTHVIIVIQQHFFSFHLTKVNAPPIGWEGSWPTPRTTAGKCEVASDTFVFGRLCNTATQQCWKEISPMVHPQLFTVRLWIHGCLIFAKHEKGKSATVTSRRLMLELIVASPVTSCTTDPPAPESWPASLAGCWSRRDVTLQLFCCLCRLSSTLARSLISQTESWLVSGRLHGATEQHARIQSTCTRQHAVRNGPGSRALLSESFLVNKQFAQQAQMSAFLKYDSYLSWLNKRQAAYEDPQGASNGFWTYKGVVPL